MKTAECYRLDMAQVAVNVLECARPSEDNAAFPRWKKAIIAAESFRDSLVYQVQTNERKSRHDEEG